ncbi:alpha/beta fold hydrolase [Amycolatopsis azurea]|uniref:Alpha/beta hydrolase n=1 Tax=Amycolatopsis azurea DSM 43854 TaxID=1238180 RepID=M2PX56_9PSEU|nr:alpha/beta hydrolase [Amycolatopsis azurea]EMD24210.1 Alpha/beta hydrolase [Amycolatopsis azurea DSM 43854]OOC07967.1 alpha/beta hydrolase [Amycolatopsis azurea DSM 43854]
MENGGVRVHGESGQPVLLLPGGAESCEGFFPGLVEGLVDDPGCRVIVHDRPGTGTSTDEGTLADAASRLSALIDSLDCGPVVVVGQSLGGAVAVLLARDHPEQVAGLVLLDPTPIDDPRTCAGLERATGVLGKVSTVPVLRQVFPRVVHTAVARAARRQDLRPDCEAAFLRTADADLPTLARAVRGISALAKDLQGAELPRLPAVVVTADRKRDSAMRRSHERFAAAFGGRVECWPGATHSVHLDHPDETLATVREVVTQVGRAA